AQTLIKFGWSKLWYHQPVIAARFLQTTRPLYSGLSKFRNVQHKNCRGMTFGPAVWAAHFADDIHRPFQARLLNTNYKSGVLATQESTDTADFGYRIFGCQKGL